MTSPQSSTPRLTNVQHRALRHMPFVLNHMARIARKALDRHPRGHLYEVIIRNDPGDKRGRVYIKPKGIEGVLDDAENSTLLKIRAQMRGAK